MKNDLAICAQTRTHIAKANIPYQSLCCDFMFLMPNAAHTGASLRASDSRRLCSAALGYERSLPATKIMVLKLRHDRIFATSEFLAAKWAESHGDSHSLDCLSLVFKIMVHFKIFLCRNPVQIEIDIGPFFFKPCLSE